MADAESGSLVELEPEESIWERCFTVFPLVVIGTREKDGSDDLAPKHLAMPLSWKKHFGFVCTPRHNTYQNIQRTGQFTVSYVRPSQTVLASLAASPRCDDGSKPIAAAMPTFDGREVDAPLLRDGYLFLECRMHRIIDELDDNSLIMGQVLNARVAEDALRSSDHDDADLIYSSPLLAYLYPGRFTEITESNQLPVPAGFKR